MSNRKRQRTWDDENFFEKDVESAPLPELNIRDVDAIGFGGMSLPVIRLDNGDVRLGDRFIVTQTGVVIDDKVTETEYWAFFDFIKKTDNAIQWMIGDMVVHGEDKFGKDYDEIAKRTGYERETIKQYAHVARNIPALIRINAVAFSHHQIVAASVEQEIDKIECLRWCAEYQLSKRHLELAIGIWKNGGDPNEIFSLTTPEKPTLVQKSQIKLLAVRESVLKKAKSKKERETWLKFACDEAEKWQEIISKIQSME